MLVCAAKSEFPWHSLLQCFALFSLTSREGRAFSAVERQRHNDIMAFVGKSASEFAANAFCVDPGLFKTQYDEVLPIACNLFHSGPQITSREAWRGAVVVHQRTA
eukprot:11190175-Lingulodinium_polyedra.AAC.1